MDQIPVSEVGKSKTRTATDVLDSPWRSHREREPKRAAKTEAVLLAAARLFTRNGFQGTSLDDIAQSLGVTKPTLYYYVESKEQILFECVDRGLTMFRAGIEHINGQGWGGRQRLVAVMELYAKVVTSDFGLCVSRVGEDPLPEIKRRELRALKGQVDTEFRDLIEEGMREDWIVKGDSGVAAFTVVGALSGIGRWYKPEIHSSQSLADAVKHCIEMLLCGVLCAPSEILNAMPILNDEPMQATRREVHFENRIVRCFTQRPANLCELLTAAVETCPDRAALVCGELRLSWRELHHAASKCASGLAQRGVEVGDRLALYMSNGPEFVIATLACAWLGAVLVPINARARGPELEYPLSDSGARAVICEIQLAEFIPEPEALPKLQHCFVIGASTNARFETFSALMQAAPKTSAYSAAEEDLAVLLYTSGTTGRPKGAMVSHINILHSAMHYASSMSLTELDRTIVAVPLAHVTGLVAQLYTMLYCRGCTVLIPQFKAAEFVRIAAHERITHAIMVPAMYNLCLLLPDLQSHDLSHWRIGAYGGASMPTATIDGLCQRLPGLSLMNAYGATETCSPATIMRAGQTATHRDSVGQTVPCGEICIVDENSNELSRGGVGEIWIAGPMVVKGYWRNAEATASEFRGGFWRSGDIGSMDADGFVRILDRTKDMINRGGYKIYSAAVEDILCDHPQVVEAALVGVPCAVLGERVHAFVCVRELVGSTEAHALQAFCAERLADYAVPETWTIGTEPLPRNLNGKIVKRELRQSLHAAMT